MPKNKKPAGGRPAKNFDPRYAKKSNSGPGRPFHARDDERSSTARKPRWTRDDRDGRTDERSGARDDRSARDDRGARGSDRADRGYRGAQTGQAARGGYRGDSQRGDAQRGGYRGDDQRGGYRGDSQRGGYRGDAQRGGYRNDDQRGGYRGDNQRSGYRDDDRSSNRRPGSEGSARRFGSDDRGGRRFDGERPREDRAGFRRDDRAGAGRDTRGGGARDDRRRERFGDDRPGFRGDRRDGQRSYDRADRNRDADRADRGVGRDDRSGSRFDRDARSSGRRFDDRAARDDKPRGYQRDSAPRRDFRDDRRDARNDDRAPRRDDRRGDSRPQGGRPEHAGERAWRENRESAPVRTRQQEDHIDVVHERLEAQAVQAGDVAETSFADLGFGDNIVRALADLGATAPFPIQASTAPAILNGRDVLARGRTGSGKTIAFGAPLVESILRSKKGVKREYGRSPVALIMAPTRELALQIDRTVQPIARAVGLFTTQIYGGVPQGRQVGALMKGVDIIIGTPGRIGDLHRQGKLDLSQIAISVLDEADHMCELGFLEPVQEILRKTREGGQKLLFSATLDREVAALVNEFLVNPEVYEVAGETQETGTIDHRVLVVDQRRKGDILEQLVDREGKTLVFTRTRAYAEMLAEQFDDAGIDAISLHGDLNQAKRTRNIERFSKGRARVLVATDVAARGIHVDDIDLVVQADAPDEYKTYMHRSGRTGRAGREGRVVTLIPRQRRRRMADLLQRAEIEAPFDDAQPGDELVAELAGAPTVEQLTS